MATQSNKIDLIIRMVESEIEAADAQIAKFAEGLSADPVAAFEWADKALAAAADRRNAYRLLNSLKYAKSIAEAPGDAEKVLDAGEVMERLDRDFSIETRQQGLSDSTSGSHRLMNQARSEAAARWFDPTAIGPVTRKSVRDALVEMAG